MQLTAEGFSISTMEVVVLIFAISVIYIFFTTRASNYTPKPKPTSGYLVREKAVKKEPIKEPKEEEIIEVRKMEFTEKISGVPFTYDEKTRMLTIGKDTKVTVKLENGIEDFRDYVDRLEEYVQE